jgi:glycosyltransferase involved in cell wall biosynthesis
VLLLSQFFYPETAAVAQYTTEIALHLQQRGLEVTVMTSRATYQRGGRLPTNESYCGLRIRRALGTRFDKRNLAGRILNLGSFVFFAACESLLLRRQDALVISNAPLLGAVGYLGKLLRRRPYICIIEDVYPDLAVKLNVFSERSLICKLWRRVNALVYANAAAVITLGDRMKEVVETELKRCGVAPPPISVINSWADGDVIRQLPKHENWFAREHKLDQKLTVLYSGNMGLAHDLETVIEAADRLRDDDRFHFLFIGDGGKKKALVELAARKGLQNVTFLPYQPVERLPYSLTCGDISVVTMESGVEGLIIPSKIYGSLAAGQAILGLVSEKTEVADIILQHKCGFYSMPGDVSSVVERLKQLASDIPALERMKSNARRAFDERFRRDLALEKYFHVIADA